MFGRGQALPIPDGGPKAYRLAAKHLVVNGNFFLFIIIKRTIKLELHYSMLASNGNLYLSY